jgi:hypothetical protein
MHSDEGFDELGDRQQINKTLPIAKSEHRHLSWNYFRGIWQTSVVTPSQPVLAVSEVLSPH